MIKITEMAQKQLLQLWANKKEGSLGLYLAIAARSPRGFEYTLRFPEKGEELDCTTALEIGDMPILIDNKDLDSVKDSTIDFSAFGGGFRIDNPNPIWVWDDPIAQAVQDVLTNHVNPRIASHGGMVTLLEVKDNIAYVEMGGGCVGCGLVDVTLKQGVEVAVKMAVSEIEAVIDRTDHASGTNPYFQESKGGGHHQPSKGGDAPSSPFE